MALQLPNAHSPMLFTLSGMSIVESLVYLKAELPMERRLVDKVTAERFVQL